ncbi:MAG: hypothetical protein QOD12_2059, partial [Verrucomicrobiota bacterium]
MTMPRYFFSIVCGVVAIVLCGAALRVQPLTQSDQITRPQLAGKTAADYLVQTADGQSLMQALTAARFGLQWQEH